MSEPASDKSEVSLVLQLFGAFDIILEGRAMPRLRTRKGQWLLALLVLRQGRAVERGWLAETLWPESLESQALANLRLSLTDLRRALGAAAARLQAPSPRTLAFDLTGATVDLSQFDRDIASGAPMRVKQAVALYRGPLLEECAEAWALPERAAREQAYLNALEKLAEQARNQRDPAAEAEFLQRVLAADPYRESALCALMTACAAKGDHAAVTAAYRDFRLRLHEEFHSQPDAETTALHRRLLDGRKSAAPAAAPAKSRVSEASIPSSFPNPLTPLLGREKECEELASRLQVSRLVTLKGPGGSGKTRLAIELGRLMNEAFGGQVWFISLAELPDARRLPEAVRDALHLPADPHDPFKQVVNRLSTKPALLILDNYEHLIENGAGFVRELLASAPLLHCLVTSRHSLNLAGEMVFRVPPLALPVRQAGAAHLLQFSGVQLFVERAAARRAEFQITPENANSVIDLCAKLEGMPLAIELVAAWSDALTPAQMLSRLEENFAFPGSPDSETPERHRSLQGAFDGSYALLNEAERLLLRRLSIFTGGWTLEAAEAVCSEEGKREKGKEKREEGNTADGNSGQNPESKIQNNEAPMLVLLKRLAEKSLVLFHEGEPKQNGTPRYSLQEMTRQYAQGHLTDAEREETECRHADYYFKEALRSEAEVQLNETHRTQHRLMLPDRENYNAALQQWQARDAEKGLQMLLPLDSCWIWAVTPQERKDWQERLETQELPSASHLQAKLYLRAGYWAMHPSQAVWPLFIERAYELAKNCCDIATLTVALFILGERDMNMGNYARARERLTAGRDHAIAAKNLLGITIAQCHLIDLACNENDFENAQKMAEALLQSGRENKHWTTISRALQQLASIARSQNQDARSRDYLEQALAAHLPTETLGLTNMYRTLGSLTARLGDYVAAREYLAKSLVLCKEDEDLGHEAWAYYALAFVARQQEDSAESLERMKQALRAFELCGETWSISRCLHVMARWSAGQPEQAAFLWCACEWVAQAEGHLPLPAEMQEEADAAHAALRTSLTEPVFVAIRNHCVAMSWREVTRRAYSEAPGVAASPPECRLL